MRPITKPSASAAKISNAITIAKLIGLSPLGQGHHPGGGRDVFVHISSVERAGLSSLNEGQAVEYEIEGNRGKESAVNLKIR
jgi:cold shock CspA family protein